MPVLTTICALIVTGLLSGFIAGVGVYAAAPVLHPAMSGILLLAMFTGAALVFKLID